MPLVEKNTGRKNRQCPNCNRWRLRQARIKVNNVRELGYSCLWCEAEYMEE